VLGSDEWIQYSGLNTQLTKEKRVSSPRLNLDASFHLMHRGSGRQNRSASGFHHTMSKGFDFFNPMSNYDTGANKLLYASETGEIILNA